SIHSDFYYHAATPQVSPLSLHDALPIYGFQPYGVENFLETEEAAVHESEKDGEDTGAADDAGKVHMFFLIQDQSAQEQDQSLPQDRKSTRLNSSHVSSSYAVFCLKKQME